MGLGLLLSYCFLADHQGLGLEASDTWSCVASLLWAIHSGLPRGWMVWTSVGAMKTQPCQLRVRALNPQSL